MKKIIFVFAVGLILISTERCFASGEIFVNYQVDDKGGTYCPLQGSSVACMRFNDFIKFIDNHKKVDRLILSEFKKNVYSPEFEHEYWQIISKARDFKIILEKRSMCSMCAECKDGIISVISDFNPFDISVEMEKAEYKQGEKINITIKNTGNTAQEIRDIQLEQYVNNEWVERHIDLFCNCNPCERLPAIIQPNQRIKLEWDQKLCEWEENSNFDASQINIERKIPESGIYRARVSVSYYSDDSFCNEHNSVVYSAEFSISDIIAPLFGYEKQEFFKIENQEANQSVRVSF
ncbi:MAG: hypothetical protein AB1650_03520 [Candidatus Omnitrophota bacterium]